MAHESVGAMPTDCRKADFTAMAQAAGYKYTERVTDYEELERIVVDIKNKKGPVLYEIMVSLKSRADLSRPAETPKENRDAFMKYLNQT